MTRAILFAPAGEVGTIDPGQVAATIDRALAEVDYTVSLAVEPPTFDLSDVGGVAIPVGEVIEHPVSIGDLQVGQGAGEVGAVGMAGHENTVAIEADPVCVLPHAGEVGPRNAPVCGGDREGSS